jgi:dTDP-L-rhamnose 4-epimerase
MKIALVGGEGFIGKSLQRYFDQSGTPFFVYDSLYTRVHSHRSISRQNFSKVDFLDSELIRAIDFTTFDEIFFLIAETSTGNSLQEMQLQIDVSLKTLANFLNLLTLQNAKPKRIVLTSSRAVYGEGYSVSPEGMSFLNEKRSFQDLTDGFWETKSEEGNFFVANNHTQQPNPISVYGDMKLLQEKLLQRWCEAKGVKLDIFRLQNVVGPGQSTQNTYSGFLTFFTKLALTGKQIDVFEGGGIVRDLIHVDDVAEALVRTGTNLEGTEVYDIGSGMPITLEIIASRIVEKIKGSTYVLTENFRMGDVRKAYADITKAQTSLKWAPKRNLDQIILDVIDWVRKDDADVE